MEINYNQILQYFSENLKTTYLAASEQAREIKLKFEYALCTLTFASLALSVQFSASFGNSYKVLLLISWLLMLIAGIAGGYRLMLLPELLRLSGVQNYLNKRVQMGTLLLKNQSFIDAVGDGLMLDPDAFMPNSIDDMKKGHAEDASKLKIANKEISRLEYKLPIVFYVQLWGLVASYFVLSFFISINSW